MNKNLCKELDVKTFRSFCGGGGESEKVVLWKYMG